MSAKRNREAWNVTDSGRRVPPQSEIFWLRDIFLADELDGDAEEARVRGKSTLHIGEHADHRQHGPEQPHAPNNI